MPAGPRPWTVARLTPPPRPRRSWWAALGVAALAGVLRLVNLGHPAGLIFDEVYYAQDAKTLWEHGVEWNVQNDSAAYVAHPPFGKWLIGLGEQALGYDEVGWRIASVLAGTLCVLVLVRLILRLTGSVSLSAVGGVLLAVEGSNFVLSRSALLDIFLTLFVLLAFHFLVADRQNRDLAALGEGGRVPYRLLSAVSLGLAMGVKWSALWFIVLALLLVYFWDAQRNRVLKKRRPWVRPLGSAVLYGLYTVGVYLVTWAGWFASGDAYYRRSWAAEGHSDIPVLADLGSWFLYHLNVLNFHEGLSTPHTYQSTPFEWLFNLRPVVFYWSNDVECGVEKCAAEVILLGTPLLWWAFVPALLVMGLWGIAKKDWRAALVWGAVAAGIVPWLFFPERTMFFFYAAPVVPFFIIAVVWCLGLAIGRRDASPERRLVGSLIAGAYVAAVILCFAYFWPIYTGEPIPYEEWQARLWLGNRWV
ncbi:dolichyl-phosphate-mannose--protein mannosyltransferase [Salininema proteolyticum]|uniref:Polyprenol-phosphate-mannose--protein mannosyltransferase n=1 Tax=Salininema proteolyticum TaxID=1607685 RepID=A0ABV8TZ19_9ACTN